MIPPYQLTSLALAEQQAREAERRRRHDPGEPGAYRADLTRRAGSRLDLLLRLLPRRVTPAQRSSAA